MGQVTRIEIMRDNDMNPFVITLILCSTLMHATWNLLARHRKRELDFFKVMLMVTAIGGFVPAIYSEILTRSLPLTAWVYVAGSGFCCGMYYFFLGSAYKDSDFTVVYPVIRSLPVLLVSIGELFRNRYPTPIGWLGILLVTSGCFLTPLRSVRAFSIRPYLTKAMLWMLLGAIGIVGFTLLDKAASEIVKPGPATAARYGYIFFLTSYGVYVMFLKMFKTERPNLSSVGWKLPLLAAFMNFGGYWLVLWAYQMSQRASYVIAFRQFSIVVGVIFAFVIYREKSFVVRLVGIGLLVFGLLLIGLWGSL